MIFHGFSHDGTEIKMWGKPIVDDGFIRLYNEKLSLPDLLFSAVRLTVIVSTFFFSCFVRFLMRKVIKLCGLSDFLLFFIPFYFLLSFKMTFSY